MVNVVDDVAPAGDPTPTTEPAVETLAPSVEATSSIAAHVVAVPREDASGKVNYSVRVPGGKIHYYGYASVNIHDFYAICDGQRHKQCRMVRTANSNHKRPAQGRPLGLLMEYLRQSNDYSNKETCPHL